MFRLKVHKKKGFSICILFILFVAITSFVYKLKQKTTVKCGAYKIRDCSLIANCYCISLEIALPLLHCCFLHSILICCLQMYQKRYPILLIYIGLIGKIDCWTSNYELKVRRLSSDHNIRDHNSMNIYSYIGIMNINIPQKRKQSEWASQ